MKSLEISGILIVAVFSVNLIFGLPVDCKNDTIVDVSSENSTNNTHKEL